MANYEKIDEVRHQLGWTNEELAQFVTEMNDYFEEVIGSKNKNSSNSAGYSDEEMFLRRILAEIGIGTNIKGYYYVMTAILLCIEDSKYYDKITTRLYPEVAEKHQTTYQKVERAIRHAVEQAWNNGNSEFYNEMFSYSISVNKGKPTNSLFITTIAEYIKMYLPKWRSGTWKP